MLLQVVSKWSDVDYLNRLVGVDRQYKIETSKSNHFMYWRHTPNAVSFKARTGWEAPTGSTRTSFSKWLKTAVLEDNRTAVDRTNMYFRVSSSSDHSFLYKELPFFRPQEGVFMVDPHAHRGIHCRFGKCTSHGVCGGVGAYARPQ